MRQAGTLATETAARQFIAWLATQRISALAEPDGSNWAVWVRDEDQLAPARDALTHFQTNPQDPRYHGAEKSAAAIFRDEQRQQQAVGSNIVQMRGRWGSGPGSVTSRRCPLVLALVAICILVAIGTNSLSGKSDSTDSSLLSKLLFADPRAIVTQDGDIDVWASIRSGQVWRLITPIFVHFGMTHLVFNLLWLFDLGGQVESRRGTRYVLLLVLVLAVLSNLGQATEAMLLGGEGIIFGGMSGVVYGLIGYVYIKTRFDNTAGYNLGSVTMFLAMLWFVLCIARDYPPFDSLLSGAIPKIANSAHIVGLFAGMAIAYTPVLLRRTAP